MNLFDLLAAVANDLEEDGVVYALVGSLASSLYGRLRMSYDADLVVRMTPAQSELLARKWEGRFHVSAEAMRSAVEQAGMANVIDAASGWKVDLSVVPREPFYDAVLARRQRVPLPGAAQDVWACSPEDTILKKPLLRKDSRSDKQFYDARQVVEMTGHRLDWKHLREWASRLGIHEDLEDLRKAALE